GDQLTALQVTTNLRAQRGVGAHLVTQEVTGGDVLDPEPLREPLALGPLARPRRTDQQHVHWITLASPAQKCDRSPQICGAANPARPPRCSRASPCVHPNRRE